MIKMKLLIIRVSNKAWGKEQSSPALPNCIHNREGNYLRSNVCVGNWNVQLSLICVSKFYSGNSKISDLSVIQLYLLSITRNWIMQLGLARQVQSGQAVRRESWKLRQELTMQCMVEFLQGNHKPFDWQIRPTRVIPCYPSCKVNRLQISYIYKIFHSNIQSLFSWWRGYWGWNLGP